MRAAEANHVRTLNKLAVECKPTENKITFRTCENGVLSVSGKHEKVFHQIMMIAKGIFGKIRRVRVSRISVNGIEMPLSFYDTTPKGLATLERAAFVFNANVSFHTQFPFNLRRLFLKNTHTQNWFFFRVKIFINLIKYYACHAL